MARALFLWFASLWSRLGAWLSSKLTNSWMTDPSYIGASAHAYGACSLVLAGYVFGGWKGVAWVLCVGIPVAALKEFWYDATYELPRQTSRDNRTDFLTYLGGAVLALVALLVHAAL